MTRMSLIVLFVTLGLAALAVTFGSARTGDAVPQDCDLTLGGMVVASAAPGTLPGLLPGDVVRFRVQVTHPSDPLGTACDVTDIDVYFRAPGESRYKRVCTVARLREGEGTSCPDMIEYTVDPSDAADGAIRVHVRAIGNLDHELWPCVTPKRKRNPYHASECVDSTDVTTIGPVIDPRGRTDR